MNLTAWVLIFIVALLISWDIYAEIRWGYTGTISYDVLTASKNHPLIPLAIGIVIGHLFWPQ
jgi:hypothetical protein